jgi:alkanesulfonate monooxygenase SsuD/methylene tetrahydromethanopterin reductase-like flavin-dependent oxidoreductase (luciferase family)
VLGATERLRVGIGVLPYPLRNVALTAMEIAALDRAFPGRFLPGLGHGVQEWMGQAGVRARSVLTLQREYVTALRSLLAGHEVSAEGDYVRLDRVRLEWPSAATPALHLAARGPKTIVLGGELGDGVILESSTARERMPEVLALLAEGRARGDRTAPLEVTMFAPRVPGDAAAVIADVRAWADAGVSRVVLEPEADEPDPVGFVEFVAREVQPAFAGA